MAKLSTILDQIDSGTVLLPEFQRGYVWNRGQVRGLMRSLYRGYPVGSLLIWETEADPGAVRGDGLTAAGVRLLLLDGQQRITTLYGIVRGRPPAFFDGRPETLKGLHFNVADEVFEFYAPAKMRTDPRWVDVSALFAAGGPMEQMAAFHADQDIAQAQAYLFTTRLMKLHGLLDREIHQEKITGSDKTIDTVVDIFNRVNSGGTKLSKGDLALAQICAEDPSARVAMREALDKWATAGYSFRLDWLLRNVNAVVTGRAPFSVLTEISAHDFADGLVRTRKYIETFLQTVQGRLGLDHDRVLMGRFAIAVVSRLLELQGGAFANHAERDAVLYWYVQTALWGRFTGSVETVLAQDYEIARREGVAGLIRSLERWRGGNLRLDAHNFEGYGMGSRFYPLLYLMTRVLEARDFGTGIPLKAEMLGHNSGLQVHHVFPKAYLYEHGYEQDLVNSVANFAFLTQETNLKIGKRPPAEYLAEVAANQPGALESQWVPTDPALWRPERYPDFLAARQVLLAAAANAFLDELRGGAIPETAAIPAVAPPVDSERDPRSDEITHAITELSEMGCVEPDVDAEIADPEDGRVLAVAEAFWPEGLQPGIGDPVVLELDPAEADLARLEELGYEVFTSTAALVGFMRRRAMAAAGPDDDDVALAPIRANVGPSVEALEGAAVAGVESPSLEIAPDADPPDLVGFDRAMRSVYTRARSEAGYNAPLFLRMLSEHGPVQTAHRLLAATHVSEGFTALWEKGRLDLTVEAVVLQPEFRGLFTEEELETARGRLEQYRR